MKKPKILKEKLQLTELFRDKCSSSKYYKHKSGAYWIGHFSHKKHTYYVYVQKYVRKKNLIDFIHIRHIDSLKALKVTEIRSLIKQLS